MGSVTKHPSALPLPSLANERTEPSSSVNNPSSHPVKDSSHSTPSEAPEPTKTASPTTPKKFPKLDKDRNATPEYRERIERDRQKYTIQFTEEDWYREPRWASRVFGGYDTVEEHLFHATAPRHGSSAGKTPTPSLSMCETNSSKSCDVDILQSFAKENPQAYLSSPLNGPLASVLDGCLKVRNQSKDRPLTSPLVSVPESQDSTKIPQLISSTGYRTASISESEKDWLKKTDAWKAEAHASRGIDNISGLFSFLMQSQKLVTDFLLFWSLL